jgi:PhnB protein
MQVQPYLQFDGRCEEALAFYKKAIGAKIEAMMRFKEGPDCMEMPQGNADKILHACFRVGDSSIMASDGYCKGTPSFQGFSLSIITPTVAETDRVFKALADGGEVQMPLAETFFSPSFGMVADRFGVPWMVVTMMANEAAKERQAEVSI